jgi:DNA-binding NarL/FixJ family response regulator
MEIIGEAGDADEVASVVSLKPDVVVMDIVMQNGITGARLIKSEFPHITIVGLSADPKGYDV